MHSSCRYTCQVDLFENSYCFDRKPLLLPSVTVYSALTITHASFFKFFLFVVGWSILLFQKEKRATQRSRYGLC